ncbi:MAG: HD domain-containing protein [Candidatus Melainabacteria bacterium]|nr:HD domain-containing protein [Candidatus Melainabacteria bacterium]MBI3307989.1 HD domain-containing protein [Candidatus Melainabacteria bacterium]
MIEYTNHMEKNVEKFKTSTNSEINQALILEFTSAILDSPSSKGWVQGVVNLLKELLDARSILLRIYSEGLTISSLDALDTDKFLLATTGYETTVYNEEPFWVEDKYVVPLSLEGCLEVAWKNKPQENDLKVFVKFFLLLDQALQIRANIISREENLKSFESLSNVEKILNNTNLLKQRLSELSYYLVNHLNISRCQIKIISQDPGVLFDLDLSCEYVSSVFVDAISVVPEYESMWIKELKNETCKILNLIPETYKSIEGKDIEKLLAIRSICGVPIVYKNKVLGVIVLHECNYRRRWQEYEVSYLKQVAFMLGVILGKEVKTSGSGSGVLQNETSKLLNQDEFLHELSHVQVHSQTAGAPFSLILVAIDKLKEINLKWGFVAGNLVLSQTLRNLRKQYNNHIEIARYNNDELVLIMQGLNEKEARSETEELKTTLSNVCVLGIGPVNYNFSFVTYPTHAESISNLLTLLAHASKISKARGYGGLCGVDEIKNEPKKWQEVVTDSLPEILLERTSFKTGPEFIESISEQIKNQQKQKTFTPDILDSVQSLALALDAKDSYTEGHSKRVSEYAYMLAKHIGLEMQEQEWVRLAAAMHDIGKIGIPESILCKPDKLTNEEFEIMKKHPVIGARILKPIKPLEKVAHYVLYHHESWNGLGYPHGLSKTEIPIGSRIVSIVDAYQAMTSDRPYRARLPHKEAIKRLNEGKEKQWDPDLVDAFIKLIT